MYKQGSDNIADFISHIRNNQSTVQDDTHEYTNLINNNSVPHSMTLQEIRIASETDQGIKQISTALKSNNWNSLQKYRSYKHEFCEVDGIILRSNRMFIPKFLTRKIMDIVHRS